MFKGGSIKPVVIALLAISAIMISFSFPYLVFAYEKYTLDGYGIHYEADPVRINSESISFTEKLRDMTTAIDNSSYVYVADENSYDADVNLTKETAFVSAADAFMNLFISDNVLQEIGMDRQTLKTILFNSSEITTSKYLIIRPGSKDMYLAWIVAVNNEYGDMELIVDDETGKLLSVYAAIDPNLGMDVLLSDNYFDESFGDTVASYYEMNYIASEYSASKNSVDKFGTSSTSLRSIKLMGADPDEEVVLPYVLEDYYDDTQILYFNFFSYSALNLDPIEINNYGNDYLDNNTDTTDTDDGSSDNQSTGQDGKNSQDGKNGHGDNQVPDDPNASVNPDDGDDDDNLDEGTPTDADKKDN